ncbi:MAG: hypothetical protein E6Q95_00410 [Chitinophagaceae bacterium]|nr:MAG: hypothetical protein E6Q95_00410 [Chitinophagaceae bacterium]
MGCSSCSTKNGSKPGGCQSNGGCSSGGCNRLNTYDWLRNLPLQGLDDYCRIVEVSFNQGSRKGFFYNATLENFEKGDLVTVEGVGGFDVGAISLTGEIVRLQMKKYNIKETENELKKVLRLSVARDVELMRTNKEREPEAVIRSRAIAKQLNLDMKISQVEMQADGKKATFYYIADGRVDFRELIKVYASEFKVKVEMRQIGARQEAGKVGGIGSCGRELCCSTWLTDFKSVNTTVARYQNLSINQTKLSGQCGRLKCCLNFELDTYLDALENFPTDCDQLKIKKGNAFLVKKDIFKNLMWYTMPDSNKQYPLTIARVLEIKSLNKQGKFPEDLEPVELTSKKNVEIEAEFVDVVGQTSLRSLERADKKRKKQENEKRFERGNKPQNSGQGQSPAGQQMKQPQQQRPQQQRPPQQRQNPQGQAQRPPQQKPQQQQNPQQGPKPQDPSQSSQEQQQKPPHFKRRFKK